MNKNASRIDCLVSLRKIFALVEMIVSGLTCLTVVLWEMSVLNKNASEIDCLASLRKLFGLVEMIVSGLTCLTVVFVVF